MSMGTLPLPALLSNVAPTTELCTLSLHDALPISSRSASTPCASTVSRWTTGIPSTPSYSAVARSRSETATPRSEEHTSELQSHSDLVCRLLLEKKNVHLHAVVDHLRGVVHGHPDQ